jgi:hypothetical protein
VLAHLTSKGIAIMTTQQLSITKSMRLAHGKLRPFIEVKSHIPDATKAFLLENFATETLFKRTAYANGFADGGLQASPALARMLLNFVRNDACPEITVKTLTSGQSYEGANLWDILCFEFVAKRSFDSLLELADGAAGFGITQPYLGFGLEADRLRFAADTALEMTARPAAVAISGIQGMADAA